MRDLSAHLPAAGLSALLHTEQSATLRMKLLAVLSYGAASIGIMMITKAILTEFQFGSFVFIGWMQYVMTLVVLLYQRNISLSVSFPMDSPRMVVHAVLVDLFPLPPIFVLNTLSGLGASKHLSMPVFVMLRRFSIVLTMIIERIMLKRTHQKAAELAVLLMIVGAMIGAMHDPRLDMMGVMMVMVNNVCTALQGVVLRQKLDDCKRLMGPHGIMFYNNLFAFFMPLALLLVIPAERDRLVTFTEWSSPMFLLFLFASSVMGFILNYTFFVCTKLTSPLTTTMVGATKNILTSYVGMLFRDYVFQSVNFLGITISAVGSAIYSLNEWRQIVKHRDTNAEAASTRGETNIVSLRSSFTIGSPQRTTENLCAMEEAVAVHEGVSKQVAE